MGRSYFIKLGVLKSICGGSSKIWAGLYNGTATELALKTDTDNAKATLANAIVSKGGTATSSMTFAQLASAITSISTGAKILLPESAQSVNGTPYNTDKSFVGFGTKIALYYSDYSCIIMFASGYRTEAFIVIDCINKRYMQMEGSYFTFGNYLPTSTEINGGSQYITFRLEETRAYIYYGSSKYPPTDVTPAYNGSSASGSTYIIYGPVIIGLK